MRYSMVAVLAVAVLSFGSIVRDVCAQDEAPSMEWERAYGGEGPEAVYAVQQTSDAGYIVVGEDNSDVWLFKVDELGEEEWSRTFGGERGDIGRCVHQTADGGYLVAGDTMSRGAGSWEMYILKVDATGELEWERTLGTGGVNWFEPTVDGGYILCGANVLMKIGSNGSPGWSKNLGSGNVAYSVQQTTHGGYVVAGSTFLEDRGTEVYLVKTDGLGNRMWSATYGGEHNDVGYSVRQTRDGGFIIAGSSFRAGDAYLIKTYPNGAEEWSRTFGGVQATSAQQTTDGGYIVVFEGDGAVNVIKTDGGGNRQWFGAFGGDEADVASSVRQTRDGGFVVAGSTRSFGAGWQGYLLKLAAESVAFRRGDTDASGTLSLEDAVSILGFLFRGDSAPTCADAADADDSGVLALTDAVFLLGHLFRGGGPLPAPGSDDCGSDPSEDALGCGSYGHCD